MNSNKNINFGNSVWEYEKVRLENLSLNPSLDIVKMK